MAETLLEYATPIAGPDGTLYRARACAAPMPGGTWQGWLEFDPVGEGETIRSPRETTQPNYTDTEYWATGLTTVYLEGALSRALKPVVVSTPPAPPPPKFDEPARAMTVVEGREIGATSVLDPFSVYEKGESLLRKQLGALSAWHLVNIAIDYRLATEDSATLNRLPPAALIDLIVSGVEQARQPSHASKQRRKAV